MSTHRKSRPTEDSILAVLSKWLGSRFVRPGRKAFYFSAYTSILTSCWGRGAASEREFAWNWLDLQACLDAFAKHRLRCDLAFSAQATRYAVRPQKADPPGFISAEMLKPIDVNAASQDALCRVPGIGRTLAHRVVIERERSGPFVAVDDLKHVFGFSASTLQLARPFLRTERDGREKRGVRGSFDFLALVGRLSEGRSSQNAAEITVHEMRRAVAALAKKPYWQPFRSTASEYIALSNQDLKTHPTMAAPTKRGASSGKCALVMNRSYFRVLENCISHASNNICIGVHIFSLSPGLRNIVAALGRAVKRGVEVRLMVAFDDDQVQADNQEAIERMHELGVAVRIGVEQSREMHMKVVIIDRGIVIVGRHNWSATSAFRAEELSCVMVDGRLAEDLGELCETIWVDMRPFESVGAES